MAAEPHDPDASLEQRVTRLERRVDHQLEHKVDAVAYGLSLVHEDVRAMRERVDWISQVQQEHGELLASHGEMLVSHGKMLKSHGEMLAEILRRLPPA
jgi:hypothetical protein